METKNADKPGYTDALKMEPNCEQVAPGLNATSLLEPSRNVYPYWNRKKNKKKRVPLGVGN